jgi:autotransporter-associated beta strand protein
MVYGESSTGNAGTLRLDNIVYGNELPVAPPSGNYWAPAAGGGGSGTWSPTGVAWATASGTIGSGTQAASAALVFGDNAGTVTVSGSVAVPAGLTISTDGYQFTSGTIALTGTSTAANTITTGSGITATVSSLLVGSNGFTKAGLGTLLLGGSNSNSGAVTVSAGTLKVNGVLGSGSLSVAAAAWLMGTGTINGPVTVNGTLAPGSSPGVLTLGSLMLTDTSTAVIEIASAGTRGTAYDGISILDAGGLTYGGTMALAFGGSAIANDTTFDVFSFTGSSAGSLAAIESTGFYAGTWTSLGSGTFRLVSGSQTLTFSQSSGDIIVVPEPAAIALVGLTLGAGSLALLRRRRRA